MVCGGDNLVPIRYQPPVASAQVKSAILLAGLNVPGETTVVESRATRDHSERMLRHFGADGAHRHIRRRQRHHRSPANPSFKARTSTCRRTSAPPHFHLVAALVTPGSDITIPNVGMNPGRIGLIQTLREMGADIAENNQRVAGDEPVADLDRPVQRAFRRRGAGRARAIDDRRIPHPVRRRGLRRRENGDARPAELRVKESDRLAAIADGLAACGVSVEAGEDSLRVDGRGTPLHNGTATIATHFDHRIAMSFLVLGTVARQPVQIDDGRAIETSFPGFADLMNGIGADIGPAKEDNA